MNLYNHLRLKSKRALLACVFLLNACSSLNGTPIQQNEKFIEAFPDVGINQIALNSTKDTFKIGDVADVSVYNVDTLSNTYVVDRAGNISFPLIGTVKVANLTTTQLQEILTQQYGSEFLQNPGINVKLESKELGSIVVDGAVNKPGVFEINDVVRLSEAIALAEGLNNTDTNGSQTYIIRNIAGERKVTEVDLRTIRKLGGADPQIIPDDVIFVQDSAGRILFREFLRTVPLLNTAVIYTSRR